MKHKNMLVRMAEGHYADTVSEKIEMLLIFSGHGGLLSSWAKAGFGHNKISNLTMFMVRTWDTMLAELGYYIC